MESQLHGTGCTSPYECEMSARSASESEPETDGEIEVIIDDGDTDEEHSLHGDINEIEHGEWQNKEHEDYIEKPYVGMLFDSTDHAYEFYNRYAREIGFSIRKGSCRRSRRDESIIWRQFLCYKEGFRREQDKPDGTKYKRRREQRVGCQAHLAVKLQVEDGKWIVTIFEEEHNHDFEKRHLLKSHRKIEGNHDDLIRSMRMNEEASGSRNVGFSANGSEPETDDEIEVIIDDGDTDEESTIHGDTNEIEHSGDWQNKEHEEVNREKPRVGMVFRSSEDAYRFYNRYARTIGFSTRKGSCRRSRKTDAIIWREFLCSREGWRREKDDKPRLKHRRETRVGCQAYLVVKLQAEDGTWVVTKFREEHSHNLENRHLQPSHRKINGSQGDLIHNMNKAGVETNLTMNSFSEEVSRIKNVGSGDREVGIHTRSGRKTELKKEDAQALLEYFKEMQNANPNFFYAFQLDPNRQFTSFFWADAISRYDYNYLGDVVYVDARYGADKYGIPFVPFIGVNHHLQTTYFGGALILDETEASYVWMLETWMKAMKGIHPKTILTSHRDSAMSGAITQVLPHTHRLYCLWHIFQDAQEHLGHLYKQDCSFEKDFSNCIYSIETIEEFEVGWESLLAKHNLHGDVWMTSLYGKRQQWVPVFSNEIFRADMATAHRGESMNNFFKDFLKKDMPFKEFVRAVDKALVHRREEELRADHHDHYVPRCPRAYAQIEHELGKIYTKSVFERFQEELLLSVRFTSFKVGDDGATSTFRCRLHNKEYTVKLCLSDSSCKCSCQKFAYTGILCSHVLKVYSVNSLLKIPSQYILKRWTRYAKSGLSGNEEGGQMQADSQVPLFLRHNSLCHQAMIIAAKGASSLEVYGVAKYWMDRTLMEVENALKRASSGGAKVAAVQGSKNRVLIPYPPIVPRLMTPCSEKNRKRTVTYKKNTSEVAQNPSEREMEVDRRPETSKKRKSKGVQGQNGEGGSKGPNANATTVGAPIKQQSQRNKEILVCPGSFAVDLNSNFNQGSIVSNTSDLQQGHDSSNVQSNDPSHK